jgi:hypothetical protein
MIKVVAVTAAEDFQLALVFNTGERRCFDMRPYLHYPVFRRLTNPGFFSLARIDYGTVTWPGEIDIAPETLYERSEPFPDEESASGRRVDLPLGNPPTG